MLTLHRRCNLVLILLLSLVSCAAVFAEMCASEQLWTKSSRNFGSFLISISVMMLFLRDDVWRAALKGLRSFDNMWDFRVHYLICIINSLTPFMSSKRCASTSERISFLDNYYNWIHEVR